MHATPRTPIKNAFQLVHYVTEKNCHEDLKNLTITPKCWNLAYNNQNSVPGGRVKTGKNSVYNELQQTLAITMSLEKEIYFVVRKNTLKSGSIWPSGIAFATEKSFQQIKNSHKAISLSQKFTVLHKFWYVGSTVQHQPTSPNFRCTAISLE